MVAFGVNQKAYAKLATEDWVNGDSTDYATWIIVTHDQRRAAFGNVNNAHEAAVNATFLMSDFDFARNDNACSAWKTGATATGTTTGTSLSYSGNKQCKPEDAYPKTTTVYTYTYTSTHATNWSGSKTHTSTFTTTEDLGPEVTMNCKDGKEHSWGTALEVTYTRDDSKTVESTTTTEGYTYYLGNGYTEDNVMSDPETGDTFTGDGQNLQLPYGGAWTANIHGKRGTVVQTIKADNMVKEG